MLCKATLEPVAKGQSSRTEPAWLKCWYSDHHRSFKLTLILTNCCVKIVKEFTSRVWVAPEILHPGCGACWPRPGPVHGWVSRKWPVRSVSSNVESLRGHRARL